MKDYLKYKSKSIQCVEKSHANKSLLSSEIFVFPAKNPQTFGNRNISDFYAKNST
jgi:hypothetical protein